MHSYYIYINIYIQIIIICKMSTWLREMISLKSEAEGITHTHRTCNISQLRMKLRKLRVSISLLNFSLPYVFAYYSKVKFLEDRYICVALYIIHILFSDQFVSLCVGEACWWTIHPASKQRSEGEKVRVGDDLILVSISSERYLVSIRYSS